MKLRNIAFVLSGIAAVAAFVMCSGAVAAPPAPPPVFGTPIDGICISLGTWPERPPRVGTALVLRLIIKNEGAATVQTSGGFAWLLLAADKERAWFSERIKLSDLKDFPAQISPGSQAEVSLDLTDRTALVMQRGITVKEGYPTPAEGDPKPAGVFGKLLPEGSFRARLTLVLPGRKEPSVPSNPMALVVGPPVVTTLSPEKKKELLEGLIAQFNKGAYGGQAAHQRAVLIGPEAVEPILAALAKPEVAAESRMWLTTALIDVGDERAIPTLLKLFAKDGAVRHVIAYHGQKMHNAKLDEAIFAAAAKGDDPTLTAWAARGAAAFGNNVPEKLIPIALASKDPRARAEIAQVLVRKPAGKNLDDLLSLLKDPDMRVRSAVAKAIGAAAIKDQRAIAALVGALDSSDDAARHALCAALGTITGQSHPYIPDASDAEKAKVIAEWKAKK